MKANIFTNISYDNIIMRSIESKDIEQLRIWKNNHKEFFFYNKEITFEEQTIWFNQFIEKKDDYMFILENSQNKIGCIGARLYEDFVDVYNVILGDKNYKGKHLMTKAMESTIAFCNLIYKDIPVIVRVLKNNPAIQWYQKIGFIPIEVFDDYLLMEYRSKFTNKYIFNLEIELTKI